MGRAFPNNKVYHSYLKNASPLVIRFRSPPKESDYTDDEIIYFDVKGDRHDKYYYQIENDAILDKLSSAPIGSWIKATFTGAKDDADFSYDTVSDSEAADATRSLRTAASSSDSLSSGNIADDYRECIKLARDIVAKELGLDDSESLGTDALAVVQSMAATIYINWQKSNFTMPLYAGMANEVDESGDVEMPDFATDETLQRIIKILDLIEVNGRSHDNKNLAPIAKRLSQMTDPSAPPPTHNDAMKALRWLELEAEHQGVGDPNQDDLPF